MPLTVVYLGNHQPDTPAEQRWSTETHIAWALEALGHRVVPVQEDTTPPAEVAERAIAERAEVFLWTKTWTTELQAGLGMLRAMEAAGIVTAGVHLDRWWGLNREHQIHCEPWFRTQHTLTADGGEHPWAAAGVNHHWLPPGVHAPEAVMGQRRVEYAAKVAFVGSYPYPHPEWPYRDELVDRLRRRYNRHFILWGRGRPARGMMLNDVYASTDVVVGDTCAYGGPGDPFGATAYWSDRVTETIGRGGFLIHPHVPGLEAVVTDGVHLRTYDFGDWNRLFALIDHYLIHVAERETIRRQGQAFVAGRHTYTHRMGELLAVLAAAHPHLAAKLAAPDVRRAVTQGV